MSLEVDFYVALSNDEKKTQVIMVDVHLDERDYLLDAMGCCVPRPALQKTACDMSL